MVRIFANIGTPTHTSTPSSGYTIGTLFQLEEATPLDGIEWYRATTDGLATPGSLKLWEKLSGGGMELLATCPAVNDSLAVGWQQSPFSSAWSGVTGKTYMTTMDWPGGRTWSYWDGDISDVPPPFDLPIDYRGFKTAPFGAPDTFDHNDMMAVGPYTGSGGGGGPTPPGEPPEEEPDPGTTDPGGSLAYWLHDLTANPNSAVKKTWDALNSGTYSLSNLMGAVVGVGTTATATFNKFGALVGGTVQSALDDLGSALTGTINAGGDAFNAFAGAWDSFFTAFSGMFSGGGRPTSEHISIFDPAMVLDDTLVGQGAKTWNVPADRYILTITNPEVFRSGLTIDGIPYLGHRGWWAPLSGDIVGQYRPFASTKTEMREVGARMQGVIFFVEPEIEWTLEAFVYESGS